MGAGEPVPDDQPVVAAERVLEGHPDVGQGSDDLVALRLQLVEPDGLGMVRHVADVPLGVTASSTAGSRLLNVVSYARQTSARCSSMDMTFSFPTVDTALEPEPLVALTSHTGLTGTHLY